MHKIQKNKSFEFSIFAIEIIKQRKHEFSRTNK